MRKELKKLQNKKIAMLGLGMENYALVKYLLEKKVKCAITVIDARAKEDFGAMYRFLENKKNISWKIGESTDINLDGFDILFRSPGWPLFDPWIVKAKKMGLSVTSPMRFFFLLCPSKNIIGVTGTKGKGTTSSLITAILKEAGKKVWLGGNIGIPPFDFILKMRVTDYVVLELSSFQLEDMEVSPHIAVITNFYREHLAPADPNNPNYHKNLHEYWMSKLNIIRWQKNYDRAVLNKKIIKRLSQPLMKKKSGNGKKIFFSSSILPSRLTGKHNRENIAAALEVARILNIKNNIIERAVADFRGLEHRLEFVAKHKDAAYYDDSFATTPDSTITALNSFTAPVILLAGGAEKNSTFNQLAKSIKAKVKFLILFKGEATPRLKAAVIKAGLGRGKIKSVNSMAEAVLSAKKKAHPGDIVLLSPACASFGMFKNYKERGNLFKKEVKKLIP